MKRSNRRRNELKTKMSKSGKLPPNSPTETRQLIFISRLKPREKSWRLNRSRVMNTKRIQSGNIRSISRFTRWTMPRWRRVRRSLKWNYRIFRVNMMLCRASWVSNLKINWQSAKCGKKEKWSSGISSKAKSKRTRKWSNSSWISNPNKTKSNSLRVNKAAKTR